MSEGATLLTSGPSPFGRLTRVARLHLGLQDRVLVDIRAPEAAKAAAMAVSPLGKVPVLIFEQGGFLADSRTILLHFESLAAEQGPSNARWTAPGTQTRLALAIGLLDAALLLLYESRYHPEAHRSEAWAALQKDKISRTLSHLSNVALDRAGAQPDIGDIALAVALDYLDFRFEGRWRADHPALCIWLGDMAKRVPALGKTTPQSA